MLIYHGDNQSASRQAFNLKKTTQISTGLNLVEFVGANIQLSDLANALQTVTLFGQQNLIVLEDFFSLKKTGKEKESIVKYLLEQSDKNILVWESKNVALQLKSFPTKLVSKFDLPKRLFDYLETFSLTDLRTTLNDTEPQVIFFLLVKHLQSLIAVSSGPVGHLPAWKASKLKSQATKSSLDRLLRLHHQLLEIDYRQKNSLSPRDLASDLELWSINALN